MKNIFPNFIVLSNIVNCTLSGFVLYHAMFANEYGRVLLWEELAVIPAFVSVVLSLGLIIAMGVVPAEGKAKSLVPVLILICGAAGVLFAPLVAKLIFGIQMFSVTIAFKFWNEDPRSKARGAWRYHGSGGSGLPDGYTINEVARGHDQKRPQKPQSNEDFLHKWQK